MVRNVLQQQLSSPTAVIGPTSDTPKLNGLAEPPRYEPEMDSVTWRRAIAQQVKTSAKKGEDKAFNTVYNLLARHLFNLLPDNQKSVIGEAQFKGLIDRKQDEKVKAVVDIADILAVHPSIAVVSRLISSFNKVSTDRCDKHEYLQTFALRLESVAAEHMRHAGVDKSAHTGEVLAIHLLNKANLNDSTLTNAKLYLFKLAEDRTFKAPEKTLPLS